MCTGKYLEDPDTQWVDSSAHSGPFFQRLEGSVETGTCFRLHEEKLMFNSQQIQFPYLNHFSCLGLLRTACFCPKTIFSKNSNMGNFRFGLSIKSCKVDLPHPPPRGSFEILVDLDSAHTHTHTHTHTEDLGN